MGIDPKQNLILVIVCFQTIRLKELRPILKLTLNILHINMANSYIEENDPFKKLGENLGSLTNLMNLELNLLANKLTIFLRWYE